MPGFQTPRDALTERMQHTVNQTMEDCDAIIFVLDAAEAIGAGDRFIAERVRHTERPTLIVVNKTDRVAPGGDRPDDHRRRRAHPGLRRAASGQRPHR